MMEKINLENYEAYFLDFVEDNLSKEQVGMLNRFLESNPELKNELKEFEEVVLAEENISANLKAELLREESTGLKRTDYLMIAEAEGSISSAEKVELALLIESNPSLVNELAIFHKVKLPAEEKVVFAGKSALIQKETKVIVWWQYASAVAAAILVLVLFNWNTTNEQYNPRGFSWNPNNNEESKAVEYAFIKEELDETEDKPTTAIKARKEQSFNSYAEQKPIEELRPQAKKNESRIEEEKILVIAPINNDVANNQKKALDEIPNDLPVIVPLDDAIAETNTQVIEEFVPIGEYAKEKIKNELLKGKTFSETVLDELAELSNDKINLETEKDTEGKTDGFALNIGKFSLSRNR